MNDKLKQEYKKLKLLSKTRCVSFVVSEYDDETSLLDELASILEREVSFIHLKQGSSTDRNFFEVSKKVSQLVSMYEATLVMEGSLAVSHFVCPDGIVVCDDDIDIENIKELLGENILIGYRCKDKEAIIQGIKRGVDYLIISTPSISTKVVIEYAKWVYENSEIPLFLEVDLLQEYAILNSTNIDRFILSTNLFNSINY